MLPTYSDNWRAEGCFICSLQGNSPAYRFRFQLAPVFWVINKEVIKYISKLIKGRVGYQSVKGVYEIRVNGSA